MDKEVISIEDYINYVPVILDKNVIKEPCPHPAKHIHFPSVTLIEHEGSWSTWNGQEILNWSRSKGTSIPASNSKLDQLTTFTL